MLQNKTERRKDKRYPYPDKIEYICVQDNPSGIQKAVTINLSDSGLCLYLFNKLRESQDITITSPIRSHSRKATILWINKVQDNFFIAGAKFS
jgi:hypothetical protein